MLGEKGVHQNPQEEGFTMIRKVNHFFLVFWVTLLAFLVSCLPAEPTYQNQQARRQMNQATSQMPQQPAGSVINQDTQALGLQDPNLAAQSQTAQPKGDTFNQIGDRIEPYESKAFINPNVGLKDSGIFSGVQVPSLQIQFDNAEFAQIMRCAASYKLETAFGQNVTVLDDSLNSRKEKKGAWFNALRDNRNCKVISYDVSGESIQDYTAPTGTFYYILNPCIRKDTSVTRQDDCSYSLSMTNTIAYEEQIRQELQEQSIKISEIEQRIQAHLNEAYLLSELLETKIRACENTIAMENATKKNLQGLLDTALYAGSFAATIMATGDIGNATMAAELATQIGGMQLKKSFGLGEISNSCMDAGKYTAYDSMTGQKTVASQRRAARYEAMYGIVETYNGIEKILMDSDLKYASDDDPGDGGLLKLALDEYSQVLYEMAEVDNRVLSLEQIHKKQGGSGGGQ